jgi:hypothetical protein
VKEYCKIMNLKTGKIEEFGEFSIFTSLKDVDAGAHVSTSRGRTVYLTGSNPTGALVKEELIDFKNEIIF